jgi:hypothetical protein
MHTTTTPWSCQLLHTEECDGGCLLDLVALDQCPFADLDVPSATPFTIRLLHKQADTCRVLIDDWIDEMSILTIRVVQSPPRRWLSVSGNGRHLVVEIPHDG